MPHMVTDQLSEVELLKHIGDFQWRQIGQALDCPSAELANDAGDRLYASFINVETSFTPSAISRFGEGDLIDVMGTIRFYARQFIEGWALLDKSPLDEAEFAGVDSLQDLRKLSRPWIYMTNALVARVSGNMRLKTFRPKGVQDIADLPNVNTRPLGMIEHDQVLQVGSVDFEGDTLPIVPKDDGPVHYEIMPENDLNGAGLLYFARYLAMMNYAERMKLQRGLRRPLSTPLLNFLSTSRRRIYYFANAPAEDAVLVYSKFSFAPPRSDGPQDPLTTDFGHVIAHHELYRQSDGALMAISRVDRGLIVPNRIKALQAEARRFVASLQS